MLGRTLLRARGFSLIEVLVATAMLTAGLVSLVPLFTLAAGSTTDAAYTTGAAVLAQQKLEELRTIPVTEAAAFAASPASALQENIVGYVDYVDANGRVLDSSSTTPPRGTSFTRRWSIAPLAVDPAFTVVVQVAVAPQRDVAAHAVAARSPGVVRLVTVRTRRLR